MHCMENEKSLFGNGVSMWVPSLLHSDIISPYFYGCDFSLLYIHYSCYYQVSSQKTNMHNLKKVWIKVNWYSQTCD